jgi:hypothetical protein
MKIKAVVGVLAFFSIFLLCVAKIVIQNSTTALGYKIADLKHQEAYQLKKRSVLTLKLASLTTKESLEKIIGVERDP